MYKRARTVKAPVASSSTVRFESADRRIELVGREFVTVVSAALPAVAGGTSLYSTTVQLLRPTDTQLFAWMSGIAKKFERYKFTKLCFVYESQCPTSTSGSVSMWFDPDPTHTTPSTWSNMINTGVNAHGAPWTGHVLDIPRRTVSSRSEYYIKNEFGDANANANALVGYSPAVPSDPLEYFAGMYGFATQDVGPSSGTAVQFPIGKVYLDYAITLQTQAVNQWNETSLTGKSVSAESAANSGTGLYVKSTTYNAGVALNYIFGFVPGTGTDSTQLQTFVGSQYFNVNSLTGVCTVNSNIDVSMYIGVTQTAIPTGLICVIKRGTQADVAAGTVYTLTSAPNVQAVAVAGVWTPLGQYPAAFGTGMMHWGSLRLYAGDTIAAYTTYAAAQSFSDVNLYFQPWPFGLTV